MDPNLCSDTYDCTCGCTGAQPDPSQTTSYDTMAAIASIADGITTAMRSKEFDKAAEISLLETTWQISGTGYIAAGVLDGVVGCINSQGGRDEITWAIHKLEQLFIAEVDYLVCEVKSIIGDYFDTYINDEHLDSYNEYLQGAQDEWLVSCPARKCLNYSNLSGNQRNTNVSECCSDVDTTNPSLTQCEQAKDNSSIVIPCNVDSWEYPGVCGTDGFCYLCYGFEEAIDDTLAVFEYATAADGWGEVLDKYNTADALSAYAKGAMFNILLYQQLVLLGAGGNINEEMMAYAALAYTWLTDRMNDNSSSLQTVCSVSEFWSVLYHTRRRRMKIGGKPKYAVRKACDEGFKFVYRSSDDYADDCPYQNEVDKWHQLHCHYMQESDSDLHPFPPYQDSRRRGSYSSWLEPNMDSWNAGGGVEDAYGKWIPGFNESVASATNELQETFVETLKASNISSILETLLNISQVGMPSVFWGAYPKTSMYPMPVCNTAAANAVQKSRSFRKRARGKVARKRREGRGGEEDQD